jgi:Xaa-Pro aminopeptidase
MNHRLRSITEALSRLGSSQSGTGPDALLISTLSNVRYGSGFTGSNALLLVTHKKSVLITDSRYKLQAAKEVFKGIQVRVPKDFLKELAALIKASSVKVLAFEETELTYARYRGLRKALKGVSLKPVSGVVDTLRAKKDDGELSLIRDAVRVAASGFKALERRGLKGRTEVQAARYLEAAFYKAGADGLSFDTLVASGERAAMPHAVASDKLIGSRELVIVDAGVSLKGYKSDQTRTYSTGSPTRQQRKIYNVVREAHDRAIDSVREGVKAGEVDSIARGVIKKAGFGRYFVHATGHGIGLDIHEAPSVSIKNNEPLIEGMVIAIEPGIYMPGTGGVRLEDMVLVKKNGFELLTDGVGDLKELV